MSQVTLEQTIEQFKNAFNILSSGVGDTTLLTTGDSDIVTAINRLDSQARGAVDADTLNGRIDSYYLSWHNVTSKPTTSGIPEGSNKYYTKVRVDSDISLRVNKPFVDNLLVNARWLNSKTDSYYTHFPNMKNVQIDSADILNGQVTIAKLAAGGSGNRILTSTSGVWSDLPVATLRGAAYLNFENGATADQTDSEINIAYNNKNAIVPDSSAVLGVSTTVYRWTPDKVKKAVKSLAPVVLPSDSVIRTSAFNVVPGRKYLCNTASGTFSPMMPALASSQPGDLVGFVDYNASFDSYPVTLNYNDSRFYGKSENLVLDKKYLSITLEFINSTRGWISV